MTIICMMGIIIIIASFVKFTPIYGISLIIVALIIVASDIRDSRRKDNPEVHSPQYLKIQLLLHHAEAI